MKRLRSSDKEEIAMSQYLVKSGPMKVVVQSTSAVEAAYESLAWWGEGRESGPEADHRRSLDAEIEVRPLDSKRRRIHRFPTFNLLAEVEGRSPSQAWDELLGRFSNSN
jgi:hypothetical protein